MKNFFKSNWIAITACLVSLLLATGGAIFFVKKSTQEHQAASLKAAEELQTAGASLEKANTEVAAIKAALDKEKALNDNLKKIISETEMELEKVRTSLKTMAASPSSAKASKQAAEKLAAAPPPANAAAQDCRANASNFSKNKIRALQNLQVDMRRRDSELKEKQKKLDEAMENLSREKRKVTLQNSEYRWPHNATDTGNK